jgi:hypothetical protein
MNSTNDQIKHSTATDGKPPVISWVAVSERLPEFGETVLVYCKIYGRFLATYEFIGEFQGEKYGNWRDFNGNLGILPPVYWLQIPEPPFL